MWPNALAFVSGALLAGLLAWWVGRRWLQKVTDHERDLLRRTRRAERLAELGSLAGHLAHEIRNPLSTIKLNLQLLSEDIARQAKAARFLSESAPDPANETCQAYQRQLRKIATVTSEADRLAETLNDFLRYAGKIELHPARNDLHEILDELIDFYQPQAQAKNIQIRHDLEKSPAFCMIDVDLFKQAILNLFINATQAMDAGGDLMIQTHLSPDTIVIDIIDTGAGIPLDRQQKVFDPYFTTRTGGTGLGLPTCRRIIEEHNGEISLHSEVGKGSKFTIVLPRLNE